MRNSRALLRGLTSIFVAALLWELAARFLVANPLFFTPLSSVLTRGHELWKAGELQTHIGISFTEFAAGFLLSCVLGILGGIAMASSRAVEEYMDPWVSMLYAMPTIALGPLFILWFGIGFVSKISIIVMIAVFPIVINTMTGLHSADRAFIDTARSFGGSSAQIYAKVRLPAALPYIIAGCRVSVARALVGVVVAELFGARGGLGYLIVTSAQMFDTAGLFVGVLTLAIWGVLSVELLKALEKWLAPWRYQQSE